MKILNRKLRRDLFRMKGLLAAVTAIIAVGIGCFVGMLATYSDLDKSRADYYNRCRMADFWIDLKKAPLSAASQLENINGISEIRERIVFPVIVDLAGIAKPIGGQVISMPTFPKSVINDIILKSGSYFTPESDNQVIVSEKFAQAHNIKPGSFINLILNGQSKKIMVMGTAISAEYVYIVPPGGIISDPGDYGIFYIKNDFAEDTFGFHGACNNIVGLFTASGQQDTSEITAIMNQKIDQYGVSGITLLKDQFSNLTLNSEMAGLQTMATFMPLMFLGIAVLVLNVLMTRIAEQQRTIIGTLKALGYANKTLMLHFLNFGLLVGIAGTVAGCGIGYWLAGSMVNLYKNFFAFPRLESHFYPGISLIAAFISILFAVLGTINGVRRVFKLNPAEAMREKSPATGGSILLEQWHGFWIHLNLWWQIVLRGIFRNKIRTIIAMVAAILGSAMVLLAFGFLDSMDYMIDFQFTKILLSNYDISVKEGVDRGAVAEIQRLPGVIAVEPIFTVPCTFHNDNHHKKGAITGLVPGAQMTVPRKSDGTPVPVPATGLLVTSRLADQLGVKSGDMLQFVPVRGEKTRHQVPVIRTIDSMIGLSVYANYNYLNRLVGEQAVVSQIQVKSRQTRDQQKLFFQTLKQYPKLESVAGIEQQKKAIKKQMTGILYAMAVIMILFAGIIFFGSILNGSLISIAERAREIATFRVLGYQPMEIGGMFLRENIIINMLGAVIGLPLGSWMLSGMMSQYSNDAYSIPALINTSSLIWTLMLSLSFVLATHFFVQLTINKLDWNEALNMKE